MYLWNSEAVSNGHPDKVADQIADSILDAVLSQDPTARVASEVTILKDFVLLSGEITTTAKVNYEEVARNCLIRIGYDRMDNGFDARLCEVVNKIANQSPEIAAAVIKENGEIGAGDQGLMFGYATDETPTYMPWAHYLAFQFIGKIEEDIARGRVCFDPKERPWNSLFRPDAKTQVTLQYDDKGKIQRVHTVVISVCHKEDVTVGDLHGYLYDSVISPVQKKFPEFFDKETKYLVNPAGIWNVGGPASDTGLSGRKIVVDNYGPDSPIGGGSFSGKDPTKVDRSAAYAARHLAKNLVAAGHAKQVWVQLSYAIGIVKPVSVRVIAKDSPRQVFKDGYWMDEWVSQLLTNLVQEIDLSPKGIIDRFNLRRPIYTETASGGHFGRDKFPWEQLDLVGFFKDGFQKFIPDYSNKY